MIRLPALLITLLVVVGLGVADRHAVHAPRDTSPYLVLIVIDGFRPDYMTLAPMAHLHQLMNSGMTYDNAWVGQLASETPTGHATVATGVYPRKHGVIDFGWRAPDGQSFSWMPTDLRQLNPGDMEHLIESGGVPSISDLIHRTYPHSTTAAMSAEKYYAADPLGTGADYILYGKTVVNLKAPPKSQYHIEAVPIGNHIPPASSHYQSADMFQPNYAPVEDQFSTRLAVQLVKTVRPRALLVNLPGADIQGHESGGVVSPNDMRPVVRGVDNDIGRIMDAYRAAGLFNRTIFLVTADHGMVPNGHIAPIKQMYAAVRAAGYPALESEFDATTAGYLYLRNPADAPAAAAKLVKNHFSWVEGVLYKTAPYGPFAAEPSTAAHLGPALTRAYLDLADTFASPSGPDVVLPYAEDTLGITVKGYGPHWGWHGGFSWRVQHVPLVISGPGVKHGVSAFPAKLVDIAPTVERLMNLQVPSGVDGVVLADALRAPTAVDAAAQRAVAAGRTADVRALAAHSAAQHAIVLGR